MNETEQERQERAEDELRTKMRLEKPLAVASRQLLRAMSDDMATQYQSNGTVLDADQYFDEWVGLLTPTYRRAGRLFGNQTTRELNQFGDDPDHSLLIAAFTALAAARGTSVDVQIQEYNIRNQERKLDFIRRQVPQRASIITETNQREMDQALADASADLISSGEAVTSAAVATLAARKFRDRSLWRGNTIAATEVQNASEGQKQIEARTLDETLRPVSNQELGALQTIKEWHTQGDEKVRQAHVEADLQRQRFLDPFVVAGELLRFPGDSSLGASTGNTINCRCVSVHFLDGRVPT